MQNFKRIQKKASGYYEENKTGHKSSFKRVSDKNLLIRLKKLPINPKWSNIRVSLDPYSYIQAIGRDSKKNQYVYHPMFTELTKNEKYKRLEKFSKCIGQFINHVSRTLNKLSYEGPNSREFVICILFKIMILSHFRVGNDTYDTFGLTTLERRHINLKAPNVIIFDFIGKKNVKNYKEIRDNNIYDAMHNYLLKNKTGYQKVFIDKDGHVVSSIDMNNYLQKIMGPEFTCKDFRTYASNKIFVKCLCDGASLKESYECVSKELCHTKFVSKKSYVMGKIEELYKKDKSLFNKGTTLNDILNHK